MVKLIGVYIYFDQFLLMRKAKYISLRLDSTRRNEFKVLLIEVIQNRPDLCIDLILILILIIRFIFGLISFKCLLCT